MYPILLNFDDYKVRCSGLGYVMTEPKAGNPKEKYETALAELQAYKSTQLEKIEKEEAVLEGINKEKAVKTWEKQDVKVKKLKSDFETELPKKVSIVSELEKRKDDIILSETCKKYLLKVYIEHRNGRRKDLVNRYVKKGNQNEDNSIDILSEVDDAFYTKNQIRIHDEFIEGECDIEHEESDGTKVIKDIKSSWDYFTFMDNTLDEEPSDIYWWQGQGYMRLFKGTKYELCYVLTDTPIGLIEDEKKKLLYAMGSNKVDTEEYKIGCKEIMLNSLYPDIPLDERVYKQYFDKEDLDDRINSRVIQCRAWLNNYAKNEYIRIQNQIIKRIGLEKYMQENPDAIFFSEETNIKIETQSLVIPKITKSGSELPIGTLINTQDNSEIGDAEYECEKCGESYFGEHECAKTLLTEENLNFAVDIILVNETKSLKVEEKIMEIVLEESGTIEESVISEINDRSREQTEAQIFNEIPKEFTEEKVQEVSDNTEFGDAHIEKAFEVAILSEISILKSKEECLDKYKVVKMHFEKYPKIKEALFAKKESFETPEHTTTPTPSTHPSPKPAAMPTPVAIPTPKAEVKEKKEKKEVGDEEKISQLKKETDNCKTGGEVKDLFRKHVAFVQANKELMDYMIEVGKRLPA